MFGESQMGASCLEGWGTLSTRLDGESSSHRERTSGDSQTLGPSECDVPSPSSRPLQLETSKRAVASLQWPMYIAINWTLARGPANTSL
jgi:hypothetical protein